MRSIRGAALRSGPEGVTFRGFPHPRARMAASQERFARTLAGKLTARALGRGVGYRDQPSVRANLRAAEAVDNRWSSVILGIVRRSPAFRMSRTPCPGA